MNTCLGFYGSLYGNWSNCADSECAWCNRHHGTMANTKVWDRLETLKNHRFKARVLCGHFKRHLASGGSFSLNAVLYMSGFGSSSRWNYQANIRLAGRVRKLKRLDLHDTKGWEKKIAWNQIKCSTVGERIQAMLKKTFMGNSSPRTNSFQQWCVSCLYFLSCYLSIGVCSERANWKSWDSADLKA